jgi:hypothetical protein
MMRIEVVIRKICEALQIRHKVARYPKMPFVITVEASKPWAIASQARFFFRRTLSSSDSFLCASSMNCHMSVRRR